MALSGPSTQPRLIQHGKFSREEQMIGGGGCAAAQALGLAGKGPKQAWLCRRV